MAPPAVKGVANAPRSVLRFGELLGEVPAGFPAGVPSVATWTTTPPVPKVIDAEHAQRAIDSCDCSTAVGRRDRAVLLLLGRLRQCACEVVRLALEDIGRDQAQLRLCGKGGRQSLLQSPADVGAAIAAKASRPQPSPKISFLAGARTHAFGHQRVLAEGLYTASRRSRFFKASGLAQPRALSELHYAECCWAESRHQHLRRPAPFGRLFAFGRHLRRTMPPSGRRKCAPWVAAVGRAASRRRSDWPGSR